MAWLFRTLLVLPLLLAACKKDAPFDVGKDLMPKGATMVIMGATTDPNVWQRSFTAQVNYPKLAITDDAFARMKTEGWKQCPTGSDEWRNYIDRSKAVPATVYQREQHWRRNNDFLKITYAYREELGSETRAQRVTLAYQGARTGQDLDRWNKFLASCTG